jgi:Swi5-dependent recombination DNA repair protein 1
MGGPKAWREMQERQKEVRSGWDAEPLPQLDSDGEEGKDPEKRDLYAEYDIDTETANEKEARGGNEIFEDEGAEDVNLSVLYQKVKLLTCHRNLQWL